MKFFFALLATLFLAAPAWAVDVQMGSNGNLIFDPADVTISAGESVHFVNNMLPPHNVIVEDHPDSIMKHSHCFLVKSLMSPSLKQVTTHTGVLLTRVLV